MIRQIRVGSRVVEYSLRTYRRSRSIKIAIHTDGRVALSTPPRISVRTVEQFLLSKSDWVLAQLDRVSASPRAQAPKHTATEIKRFRLQARELAESRIAKFNMHYGFVFHRVSIRNQRTRWGSCSKTGNLNFNYRIALLPPHLVDYIVVHELCHLREFNHSPAFWARVAQCIPDFRECKRQLRAIGLLG